MDALGSIGLNWANRAAGFNPLTLNPLLWIKADTGLFQDTGGVTPATLDGDPVGKWTDLSGNGNSVLQGTAANKATLKLAIRNGNPVIRYDGVNDFHQSNAFGSISPPFTIVFAGVWTVTGQGSLFDGSANLSCAIRQTGAGSPVWRLQSGGTNGIYGTADGNWHSTKAVFNGASSSFTVDGTDQTPSGNPTNASITAFNVGSLFFTGGQDFVSGDFGELLFINRVLTAGEWTNLLGYMRGRWGTP